MSRVSQTHKHIQNAYRQHQMNNGVAALERILFKISTAILWLNFNDAVQHFKVINLSNVRNKIERLA